MKKFEVEGREEGRKLRKKSFKRWECVESEEEGEGVNFTKGVSLGKRDEKDSCCVVKKVNKK